MPVTLETATLSINQSIARIELYTDADRAQTAWELVYHFEDGSYENGVLKGKTTFGSRIVKRTFGSIAADTITTTDGTLTVTVAQIADLIKQAGYKYRQADIDAGVNTP